MSKYSVRLCLLWWKEGNWTNVRRWLLWMRVIVGDCLPVLLRMLVIWVRMELGLLLSVVRKLGIFISDYYYDYYS